jgi:hypothetical protein
MIMKKRTFADVYGPDCNATDYTGPEYTTRLAPVERDVYVHNCVFGNISSSEDGGALFCSSSVYRLLVAQSSFISCKTSSKFGGGICFESTSKGQCVLSRICAFNCYSTISNSNGQFARIRTSFGINYKNHINDSSITHTLKVGSIFPWYTLCLYYGIILWPSVNLTNNECYNYPAFYCDPSTYGTCCISFSSIVNNTAKGGHGCFWFQNSLSSNCIYTCNILNNIQTLDEYGTIETWTNLFIKDSCILGNNKGKTVFYEGYYSSTITISNCTIDDDIFTNTRYYGSVTVNKTIERAFINALSHIATQRCDSYFDSYGTLTVNPCVLYKCHCECSRCLISCIYKRAIIVPFKIIEIMLLKLHICI